MPAPEETSVGVPNSATSIPPPKPEPQNLDPVYYTWSNAFSIMLGRMTGSRDVALEKGYFEEMDVVKAETFCKRCETNRDYLLQYSPVVKFMKDEVAKLGGDLNSKNIHCRVCTTQQSGGFNVNHGIMLCANRFRNRGHQEDTMAHEMVHAWDYLKWKVEDGNLKHQACLEVSNWSFFRVLLLLLWLSNNSCFLSMRQEIQSQRIAIACVFLHAMLPIRLRVDV